MLEFRAVLAVDPVCLYSFFIIIDYINYLNTYRFFIFFQNLMELLDENQAASSSSVDEKILNLHDPKLQVIKTQMMFQKAFIFKRL